jgi:hypothetical protein
MKVILTTFCLQLYPRVHTSKKAVEWLSQEQKPSLQRAVLLLSQYTSSCYNVHIFFFLWFWYKSEMRCDYESQVAYRTYTVQQGQVMVGDFKEMFWNEIIYLITVFKVILCPVLYIYTHTHTYIQIYCALFCNMYVMTVCVQYEMFIKQMARYTYLQKYFMLAVLVTCWDIKQVV